MYLSRAESYDKERAESWKADADGILIFVRPSFRCISCVLQFKAGSEWSILCNCSGLHDRGTQESAAFTHFSTACCFHERIAVIRCSDFPQPFPFLYTHVCLADKHTVAPQPHREPLVRPSGYSSPTMGPLLPPHHPKSWYQAPRPCADPAFIFRRCIKILPSKSCQRTPDSSSTYLSFSFSRDSLSTFITSITSSSF